MDMGRAQPRGLRELRAGLALAHVAGDPHHRVAEVLHAARQVTPIPLMPGPWLPLAESEAQAFLERLTSVLVRSHGPAAFTQKLPISDLRVMPLSFYPGWLLVEGEAQLAPNELVTFNVQVVAGVGEGDAALAGAVIPNLRYQSPFRKVPASTMQTADTTRVRRWIASCPLRACASRIRCPNRGCWWASRSNSRRLRPP